MNGLSILEQRALINARHADRPRVSFVVRNHVIYEDREYYGDGKKWYERIINRNVRTSTPIIHKIRKRGDQLVDVRMESIDVFTNRSVYYMEVRDVNRVKALNELLSK